MNRPSPSSSQVTLTQCERYCVIEMTLPVAHSQNELDCDEGRLLYIDEVIVNDPIINPSFSLGAKVEDKE